MLRPVLAHSALEYNAMASVHTPKFGVVNSTVIRMKTSEGVSCCTRLEAELGMGVVGATMRGGDRERERRDGEGRGTERHRDRGRR